MVTVTNSGKQCIRVGDVNVRGGESAEVDSDALDAMSDKDAGPAANAMAKSLKKAAGRKAAAPTKDDQPFKAVHLGRGKWNVLDADDNVVEDGEGLKKADAEALRDKLIAEADSDE